MDRDVCGFSTSVLQYLDCAGRAAMSSSRMAAVSRLLLKRKDSWVAIQRLHGSHGVAGEGA